MNNLVSTAHSFNTLKSKVFPKTGISVEKFSLEHVQAVYHNAFKNGAIQESIYGENDYIAHESLARPKDEDGHDYSIGKIAQEFYDSGLAVEFDTLTTNIGFTNAQKTPSTFNISVLSALSPVFWEKREEKIQEFSPQDTIYEILEHDIDPKTDISLLNEKKEQGYRFALDDFSVGKDHDHRLQVLGDLVDYIKIDGPLVRAYLEGSSVENFEDGTSKTYTRDDFVTLLLKIKTHYEDKGMDMPALIAERVRSADEAKRMFEIGFTGVQGRDLKPEFFHYTPEAQALAKADPSCEYV